MSDRPSHALADVELRPRRDADRDFLCRLYASTRTDELAATPWTDEQKRAFLEWQFEAQTTHYDAVYGDARFLVVERDDMPIGRLYLQRRDDEIRVVDIALLPEHRGHGLGRRLMEDVLAEAAADGLAVRIHVETHNPAMHLYERLGFRRVDTNGVDHLMEWLPVDADRGGVLR